MFWVRVYINVFCDIMFSYYLTSIRNLTFRWIKCIPYVAFNVSFLDILFGQYSRREMGKTNATKNAEWVCHLKFSLRNIAHGVISVSLKTRSWGLKPRYFRVLFCVLSTSYIEIIVEATTSKVFSTQKLVWFSKCIFYLEVIN